MGSCILYVIALGNINYSVAINCLGQNSFSPESATGYNVVSAFVAEVVFTAIFLGVILGVTNSDSKKFGGLAIGLTLTLIHLVGIPITGVSVNPARSLGPALLSGSEVAMSQLWLFMIAPVIGGILALIVWLFIKNEKTN